MERVRCFYVCAKHVLLFFGIPENVSDCQNICFISGLLTSASIVCVGPLGRRSNRDFVFLPGQLSTCALENLLIFS